jgi:hypothetical protein
LKNPFFKLLPFEKSLSEFITLSLPKGISSEMIKADFSFVVAKDLF